MGVDGAVDDIFLILEHAGGRDNIAMVANRRWRHGSHEMGRLAATE